MKELKTMIVRSEEEQQRRDAYLDSVARQIADKKEVPERFLHKLIMKGMDNATAYEIRERYTALMVSGYISVAKKPEKPVIEPKIVRTKKVRGVFDRPPSSKLQEIQCKFTWLISFRIQQAHPDRELHLSAYSKQLLNQYNEVALQLRSSLQQDKQAQMEALLAERKKGLDASET